MCYTYPYSRQIDLVKFDTMTECQQAGTIAAKDFNDFNFISDNTFRCELISK
jgi:hypothetical protein